MLRSSTSPTASVTAAVSTHPLATLRPSHKHGWAYALAMGGVIVIAALAAIAAMGLPSRPGSVDGAAAPNASAVVAGLAWPAPFVHEETARDQRTFSVLEVYTVPGDVLSPTEALDLVLSDILALGFSNAGEERETLNGSMDHTNSVQVYLSGHGKRLQLLVGWMEPAYTDWDPKIYVMIGEYRDPAP